MGHLRKRIAGGAVRGFATVETSIGADHDNPSHTSGVEWLSRDLADRFSAVVAPLVHDAPPDALAD